MTNPNDKVNGGIDTYLGWSEGAAIDYPVTHSDDTGLTKREYFASLCLQGLLSNSFEGNFEELAKNSVKVADLLIEELNKGKE